MSGRKYDPAAPADRRYPLAAARPGVMFPAAAASTNSVVYVDCPRCGAKAGFVCVAPDGSRARRLAGGAHDERIGALRRWFPEIARLSE